jgi:hypothetical protein
MIVHSIRQLAPYIGKSHTMLNRDFARGKCKQEPGSGFDVDKVKAALVRKRMATFPHGRKEIMTEHITRF